MCFICQGNPFVSGCFFRVGFTAILFAYFFVLTAIHQQKQVSNQVIKMFSSSLYRGKWSNAIFISRIPLGDFKVSGLKSKRLQAGYALICLMSLS